MHSAIRRVAFCLVAALAAIPLLALPAASSEPAPDQATAKYEQRFLMSMIDHHAMAVQMADMCLDKAVHPELEALCENIKTSQSQQIDEMQSWLADWYGVTHEPEMTPGAMQQMERLESLSGADFEIQFMESMTRHHRQAVREGEMCVDRASHGELVDLCQNIITSQTAQIDQMQNWLCDWYDRCRGSQQAA